MKYLKMHRFFVQKDVHSDQRRFEKLEAKFINKILDEMVSTTFDPKYNAMCGHFLSKLAGLLLINSQLNSTQLNSTERARTNFISVHEI